MGIKMKAVEFPGQRCVFCNCRVGLTGVISHKRPTSKERQWNPRPAGEHWHRICPGCGVDRIEYPIRADGQALYVLDDTKEQTGGIVSLTISSQRAFRARALTMRSYRGPFVWEEPEVIGWRVWKRRDQRALYPPTPPGE